MRPVLPVALIAAIVVAGCASDDRGLNENELENVEVAPAAEPDIGDGTATEPAPDDGAADDAPPELRELRFGLVGEAAVPPGDPDGVGTAILILDQVADEICYEVAVEGIEPVTAMHLHRGEATASGPVVVELRPLGEEDDISDCAPAEPGLIDEIIDTPRAFYLDVHTGEYPDGALRGQLDAGR